MAGFELGVIGGGNMAEAILRGVVDHGVLDRGAIVISEPRADRREVLERALQVACAAGNREPAGCRRILLAVKPQVMGEVLEEIAPAVGGDATVISIAAGISTAFLDRKLAGRGHILRAMPNTPMLVGMGMTALAHGPRATEADLAWAEGLFAACGQVVRVEEPMIDAVTAVSGSGPAYFFYLIEAMIAAGVAEGLDAAVAARLATQTCAGAARLLAETGKAPETLRAGVTSPGGTTQRAMETLDAADVKAGLIRAIRAAAARSRELGK